MVRTGDFGWARLGAVLGRSVVVGATTGVLGGALIFFLFGFIGFAGASIPTRLENGWAAAMHPGLAKGLVAGLGIAVGLSAMIVVLTLVGPRVGLGRIRPWLSLVAAAIVVAYNVESLRNSMGWDAAGSATVLGISALVGVIVWLVSPWVLQA